MKIYDELRKRGLIAQVTNEKQIKNLLDSRKIKFYIGFDPTANSLHVGHFAQMMIMSHLQKAGHTPIVLFGGGTAMIGDPSGKSDMRKMLSKEEIDYNIFCFEKQMSKFISFKNDKAIMINNASWLWHLNYIDFLRNIGIHFNVNRMLSSECYKQRLSSGLSFFEINYMLMQSYDFLRLFENYGCKLQIGGDDQWSNMLAGVDLIRKLHKSGSFCLTCPLLLNADGKKMGKTEKGALWLDKDKTSPYEFYQYWRNIADSEVNQVLRMLTHLDMEEVNRLSNLQGAEINEAKKIAAYEITKLIHGEEEADKAKKAAEALFENSSNTDNMPTVKINKTEFNDNKLGILDAIILANVAPSKGQARILVNQGGISIDDEKILDDKQSLDISQFDKGYVILKKGKKVFIKLIVE